MRHAHPRQRGFTLIEMLVTFTVIGIVVAIGVGALAALNDFGRATGAVNTVSTAVNAARIYSHRIAQEDLGSAGHPYPSDARFHGTGVIFTPTQEIRLVMHNQKAVYEGADGDEPGHFLIYDDWLGYRDIRDAEYVSLPRNAGVVGIRYDGDLELIEPPFAIRFSAEGHMALDRDFIYYDSQGERSGDYRAYDTTPRQWWDLRDYGPEDYNPEDFNRRVGGDQWFEVDEDGRLGFDIEEIPVVYGVLVFDMAPYREERQAGTAGDWLLETDGSGELVNVRPIYFSPQSGSAVRKD